MSLYEVSFPIEGTVTFTLEADSSKEALREAEEWLNVETEEELEDVDMKVSWEASLDEASVKPAGTDDDDDDDDE